MGDTTLGLFRDDAGMKRILKPLYLRAFPIFERLGVHITPNHYTQPIPDTGRLDPKIWQRHSAMIGIDMREYEQLALLEAFSTAYRSEYEALPRQPTDCPWEFYLQNPFFGAVDAEMLYAMTRHIKPSRFMEIGSGFSTLLAAKALRRNADDGESLGRLDAFEPSPSRVLQAGFPGLNSVRAVRAEDIDTSEFEALRVGDILFIDSSHVVKIGGDVTYLFLEILPRLRPGVIVHIHDIFLPAEYPKDWIFQHRLFWTEQYLLQAFLTFNDRFRVIWAGSYMHLYHPDRLAAAFSSYDAATVRPGSFWIERIK